MEKPWTRARKRRSELQESKVGNLKGGSKQNNSGRFWRWKRDNRLWEFLIESRTTESDSYTIKKKEFLDIEKEALQTPPGCLPGMIIDIHGLELIAFRLNDFQNIQIELEDLRSRLQRAESKLNET